MSIAQAMFLSDRWQTDRRDWKLYPCQWLYIDTYIHILFKQLAWVNTALHRVTFSASKLLLISAPSILVCLSELDVSAPRSLPVTTATVLSVQSHATQCTMAFPGFFIDICLFHRALYIKINHTQRHTHIYKRFMFTTQVNLCLFASNPS